MRILLWANHRYPAFGDKGAGRRAVARPSHSGQYLMDCLAKGLAELGHDVFYLLAGGAGEQLAPGIEVVSTPVPDADVFHDLERDGGPWLLTIHQDSQARRLGAVDEARPNWIFVSRALARRYRSERFVWNGVDPDHYLFSATKDDYFLFISSMDRYREKGLDIALALAAELGVRLLVAGTSSVPATVREVTERCRRHGARHVGDVRGREKAELFAGAKALLFPSQLAEGCPLVIAEALMSGTPVIASDRGGCPEMVSADTGFVCASRDDYAEAIRRSGEISPAACRQRAMARLHYRRMAAGYLAQYEHEIAGA